MAPCRQAADGPACHIGRLVLTGTAQRIRSGRTVRHMIASQLISLQPRRCLPVPSGPNKPNSSKRSDCCVVSLNRSFAVRQSTLGNRNGRYHLLRQQHIGVIVSSGSIVGQGVSGTVSPSGAASAVGNASGITIISRSHLAGRNSSGSIRQSDGCVGCWTATKN